MFFFFFSSRRRHTRYWRDWSSDVCSSDLTPRPTSKKEKAARLRREGLSGRRVGRDRGGGTVAHASGGEFWTAGAGRYSRAHNKGPTHDTLASINSHRKSRVRTRRRPSASAGRDLPERGSGLRQGGAPQHARQCLEGLQARAAAGDQGRDHGQARGGCGEARQGQGRPAKTLPETRGAGGSRVLPSER